MNSYVFLRDKSQFVEQKRRNGRYMKKRSLERDLAISGVEFAVVMFISGILVKIGVLSEHAVFGFMFDISCVFLAIMLCCIVKKRIDKRKLNRNK